MTPETIAANAANTKAMIELGQYALSSIYWLGVFWIVARTINSIFTALTIGNMRG